MKTPVICYDLPVTTEIYQGYPHYAPIGDVNHMLNLMTNLMEDNELLFKDIDAASNHVRSFVDTESYANKLNAIVESIVSGKKNK